MSEKKPVSCLEIRTTKSKDKLTSERTEKLVSICANIYLHGDKNESAELGADLSKTDSERRGIIIIKLMVVF